MEDLSKCSPVDASALYLGHVRDAWNYLIAGSDPSDRFEEQDVILTVPASFDAVARELTLDAAKKAGITRITLVEEPQAAFYSWISDNEENWSGFQCSAVLCHLHIIGAGAPTHNSDSSATAHHSIICRSSCHGKGGRVVFKHERLKCGVGIMRKPV
jgi:hypothetical protein